MNTHSEILNQESRHLGLREGSNFRSSFSTVLTIWTSASSVDHNEGNFNTAKGQTFNLKLNRDGYSNRARTHMS